MAGTERISLKIGNDEFVVEGEKFFYPVKGVRYETDAPIVYAFPNNPHGAEILGVIPQELRGLCILSQRLLNFSLVRLSELRKEVREKAIKKVEYRKEKARLERVVQASKSCRKAFMVKIALHFSRGRSIPMSRLKVCGNWKAVLVPPDVPISRTFRYPKIIPRT